MNFSDEAMNHVRSFLADARRNMQVQGEQEYEPEVKEEIEELISYLEMGLELRNE